LVLSSDIHCPAALFYPGPSVPITLTRQFDKKTKAIPSTKGDMVADARVSRWRIAA
jgi:hypothetical protein